MVETYLVEGLIAESLLQHILGPLFIGLGYSRVPLEESMQNVASHPGLKYVERVLNVQNRNSLEVRLSKVAIGKKVSYIHTVYNPKTGSYRDT